MSWNGHQGTKSARMIPAIETVALRGTGLDKDPVREVKEYWTLDGLFLGDNDPLLEEQAKAYREASCSTT